MDTDIITEIADGIAVFTFNRPQARNALKLTMYQALADFITEIGRREEVRALIITGAGTEAFAAGTDIAEFRSFTTPQHAIDYEARMNAILTVLESAPMPTIAAVAGACTGGGGAIAACCDLRVMGGNLRYGFPIARTLGNCLSIRNLARLSGLIGPARVKDLLFTARLVGAEEALRIGLASEVVDDPAAVLPRARALAATIAQHAPLTIRATKEALGRIAAAAEAPDDHDIVTRVYMSADFREGMEAFLGKRKPAWTGR